MRHTVDTVGGLRSAEAGKNRDGTVFAKDSSSERSKSLSHGADDMLVLTRKVGEAIVIADKITVRVLSISGGRVRLGVEAPDELLVLRGELADRLKLDLSGEVVEPFVVHASK